MSALPTPPPGFPTPARSPPPPQGKRTPALLPVPTPKARVRHETVSEDSKLYRPFFSLSSYSENLASIANAVSQKIECESDT